jgi:hypothetical protein
MPGLSFCAQRGGASILSRRPLLGRMLAGTLAVLLFGAGTPSRADVGLDITPTYEASITGNAHAAAIEATIQSAINYYEATFTTHTATPIGVTIDFGDMNSGLGQSTTGSYKLPYGTFISQLSAASSGDSTDTTALAHLPSGATNPVNGSTTIDVKSAEARALGFNTPGFINGTFDGQILLNTSITDVNGGPYSLLAVVEHEMDEVLGTGSDLPATSGFFGDPSPEDLFRYDGSGNRSHTTNGSALAYFSLDGTTQIAQFDNQNDGGDFGDWQSNPRPGGVGPKVQDAFATPGATPTLANDGGAEVIALDALGYNLSGQSATPEPASLTIFSIGLAGMVVCRHRRRTRAAA